MDEEGKPLPVVPPGGPLNPPKEPEPAGPGPEPAPDPDTPNPEQPSDPSGE